LTGPLSRASLHYQKGQFVNQAEFEHAVLRLWMTTRVPLTRANLQFYTGVERRQLDKWLDEMTRDGTVELDSDDQGEIVYTVPGAERSPTGPTDVASVRKEAEASRRLDELRRSLPQSKSLVKRGEASLVKPRHDRSVLLGGALSFFFGPLGWLYAAPLREAAPAIAVFLVAMMLFPHLLLYPLLGILMPLSGVVGASYAWLYNRQGGRTSLTSVTRKQLPGK
jgi:hypothetical protein